MKKKLAVWMGVSCLLLAIAALVSGCPGADVVVIPDRGLELAIRAELTQPFCFLTRADLAEVNQLDARSRSIRDLTGLEYCVNLTGLNLASNDISDITPLTQLQGLTYLNLENNAVNDLGPLSGLFYLDAILLFNNDIRDLSPLVANAENGGIGEGTFIWLGEEVLSEENTAILDQIEQLRDNHITVIVAATGSEGAA
jgi:Leucine-rich repeat (LRR) protein